MPNILGLMMALMVLSCPQAGSKPLPVRWTGKGKYRLLVSVKAGDIGKRQQDEMPAQLKIDFAALLQKKGIRALPDMTSIQVIKIDPSTGLTQKYGNYAWGRSAADRPFRWYDAIIPYDFPEFRNAVSRTNGKIIRRKRPRSGFFYNVLGEWQSGRLAWMHTQIGNQASQYAIYFDLLPSGGKPFQIPPRGWLGDGLPRCDKVGTSTMGADHCRMDLDDWNGDGLLDLIVGEQYGHVLWWPNQGTKAKPVFRFARFVVNAKGEPLDAGMAAAPKVVDWDGNGIKDLLVGSHWNRLLFYENQGTNRDRKLVYRGPVLIEGKPLELPLRPLTRGRTEIFRRDYYPVPEVVDWDGDGDLDLLAGGYITGLMFLYENTGPTKNGTPRLQYRGPLQANERLLNVGHWCASPCAADFDGDGDLDLMTGNFAMYPTAKEQQERVSRFVLYYENVGTAKKPKLVSRAFPGTGTFPAGRLATPRAGDWDGDGDLDLAISADQNVYLMENKGTKSKPKFQKNVKPLLVPWGMAPISVSQFRDWNQDGHPDLIRGYSVHLNDRVGNPWRWSKTISVLPKGKHIAHPSGIGDDWFWPFLDDFDQDGKVDVLFGDWWGHLWLHRNQSTATSNAFDLKGFRLKLANNELIKVGPINKDPKKDFDALQGARTVFTVADFDRDGRRDLVVGDTYGIIRLFRNISKKSRGEPVFAEPVTIGNIGTRGLVDAIDWNGDKWIDVIASGANGRVRIYLNNRKKGTTPFAEGIDPGPLPIEQPRALAVDLNRDGDDDLFLPSTQGSCYVERSFLEKGYAPVTLLSLEKR